MESSLIQIVASCLFGTKPLPVPILTYCYLDPYKLHWSLNQNSTIFIQEYVLENIVCKMAAIVFKPQCVKNFTLRNHWKIFITVTSMKHVALVAITETTLLVPCQVVKFLQLIWRSGTCRWNLRVPDLQMSCNDLTWKIRHQASSPSHGHQGVMSLPFPEQNPPLTVTNRNYKQIPQSTQRMNRGLKKQ